MGVTYPALAKLKKDIQLISWWYVFSFRPSPFLKKLTPRRTTISGTTTPLATRRGES